ncbi:MAG TPA: GspH/FimT family pseudopilin [Gammaproteobacteria bacterium]|nr:GspH/FimT family pseudopilin [Gammaproteobacteria bacterium]
MVAKFRRCLKKFIHTIFLPKLALAVRPRILPARPVAAGPGYHETYTTPHDKKAVTETKTMTGRNKGFTLIELMVTIAIAAILVTAGVPAFNQFVQENRMAAQVNSLVHALNIARSEAVSENTTTVVCASSDQVNCTTDWNKGWIVFADKDGDGKVESGELLHVFPAIDGGNTLTTTVATSIGYEPSGLSTTSGTFTLCDGGGDVAARAVIVSPAGAIRTAAGTCS